MNVSHIIRAWKDPVYRAGLTQAELAGLPAHPSGAVELSDEDIGEMAGGRPKVTENWACSLPTVVCRHQGC